MSYRKIDTRIWNDAKFLSLADDTKLLFFFCLTHPNLTMLGAMRVSRFAMAEELGWLQEGFDEGLPKRFSEAFSELLLSGMIRYDTSGRLLWLPNFLKYNPLENQNQCKGASSALDLLPECSLKTEIISHTKDLISDLSKGFSKGLPKGFMEGFGQPGTGTGTEKETVKTIAPKKTRRQRIPKTDHSFFTDWWCFAFNSVEGYAYAYDAKDAGIVKNLLDAMQGDVRQLVMRACRLLISEEDFHRDKKTLGMLSGCINQLPPIGNGDLSACREFGIVPPDGVKLMDWKFWEQSNDQP